MNILQHKPDWIRTSEVGSFAESTIKQRKPEIIRRILNDNEFSPGVQKNLDQFMNEITGEGAPKPLQEISMDVAFWNEKLQNLQAKSWFDLPWYFAEAFFYRKVLEAVGYYQSTEPGFMRDPFHKQKANQLEVDLQSLSGSLWLFDPADDERTFERLIMAALWGNRADLSHMDIDLSSPALDLTGGTHLEILLNDLPEILDYFSEKRHLVAYLTDNVGRELYSDLALVEYLLSNEFVENITMLVKPAPLFVSDAMRKDVDLALQLMRKSGNPVLNQFVDRVYALISSGRLVILEEPSLCNYKMFEDMPFDFYRNLETFDLTIVKGDANFRRVVGDRHWDFSSAIEPIVEYFPTDVLLLRTLKSEIVVGLSENQIETLNRKYENWLVKGFCGVVQLIKKNQEIKNE